MNTCRFWSHGITINPYRWILWKIQNAGPLPSATRFPGGNRERSITSICICFCDMGFFPKIALKDGPKMAYILIQAYLVSYSQMPVLLVSWLRTLRAPLEPKSIAQALLVASLVVTKKSDWILDRLVKICRFSKMGRF